MGGYDDLREANRRAGAKLSRVEARRRIAEHPLFLDARAAPMRAEILALVDDPRSASDARERCDALVVESIRARRYLVRPGTVEELWWLEGLLDRALSPR